MSVLKLVRVLTKDGVIHNIYCGSFEANDAGVLLFRDGERGLFLAIAAGMWTSCRDAYEDSEEAS